jgi:hypothetical protein
MNQATQASTNTSVKAQDPLATELAAYQRELSRLLAEGEDGRWVDLKLTAK